jgi:N-carbamoyl-L-amino-acid hydrolase
VSEGFPGGSGTGGPGLGGSAAEVERRFRALWRSLEPIGRDPVTGGYLRYSWSEADLACREWFVEAALDRQLRVETDPSGNIWAWWGDPAAGDAVVAGSHLDSVPHGGAYDGPLGVVSGLLAIDLLRERGVAPRRPIGLAVFTEEEGSRFGLACLGSRLLTGVVDPRRAHSLVDRNGVSLARAMAEAEVEPAGLNAGPGAGVGVGASGGPGGAARVAQLGAFIEVHIEQGRALVDLDAPVGVASTIWPHGRWRFDITGEANHAGTTAMADRRDPMLTFAYTVLAANKAARLGGAHATMGRVNVEPNATNAIPARVTGWLDARAAEQSTLDELLEQIRARVTERAGRDRTTVDIVAESVSAATEFDVVLRDRIAARLRQGSGVAVPILATGAGHDAGVLCAAGVPAAMLFVRNPTGVSHAPAESASDADCAAGVLALASVLEDLACR